jgi:hypothetical protein
MSLLSSCNWDEEKDDKVKMTIVASGYKSRQPLIGFETRKTSKVIPSRIRHFGAGLRLQIK